MKVFWKYIGKVEGLLLIIYSIFVFSSAVIVSDNFSKVYFVIAFVIITLLSIIICPYIIKWLSAININNDFIDKKYKTSTRNLIKVFMFVLPFIVTLVYYIAYYPGVFTIDSLYQTWQAENNQYDDWHPIIHTLLTMKLPLYITGGWQGSIVLFQIIVFSLVIGYALSVVLKYSNLKYTIVSMCFIILNPQFGYIAMNPIKDTTFAIGAVLLSAISLEIYMTKGEWLNKIANTVIYIITASLTTLFRHNAILFTAPLIIATLVFVLNKKRMLIVCLSVIFICFFIKVPLYNMLDVEKPSERQVESLGLPMTVIGAAVTYTPENLDDDILEFAYKVAPKEVWRDNYDYGRFNTIKYVEGTDRDVIEEYGFSKIIPMALRTYVQSKYVSMRAFVKLTEPVYSMSDICIAALVPEYEKNENEMLLQKKLEYFLYTYDNFVEDAFPHIFFCLGVLHFVLIASVLSKSKLNTIDSWKRIIFVTPVFVYNFGSGLLMSDEGDASRFFYYTFLLMPILLVFFYNKEQETCGEC